MNDAPPISNEYPGNLPRLPREYYQGDAVVFWTLTTFDRAEGWLNDLLHQKFRELLLHAMVRQHLVCPIYCLMPDHIHFVWMGLSPDSDQLNGIAFFRTYLEPALMQAKLQPQAHDHVLRTEERRKNAFAKVCHYIAENPVRAGFAPVSGSWPYTGCLVPGYPRLSVLEPDFWDTFWKVYSKLKDPAADQIVKPPFWEDENSSRRSLQTAKLI